MEFYLHLSQRLHGNEKNLFTTLVNLRIHLRLYFEKKKKNIYQIFQTIESNLSWKNRKKKNEKPRNKV